jgi:mono/diheme cytochrome c family protein
MSCIALAVIMLVVFSPASLGASAGDPNRGEYVTRLGGCHSCHANPKKKGAPLAGGLKLPSPFGTFHVPNITPDPETGIEAYLNTVRPVRNEVPPHDMRFPYNFRLALSVWKWLFFYPGSFKPNPKKSASWNRGAYIVTGPGHCGECHTARNFFGATDQANVLAGTKKGPDGNRVPNITPHPKDGIGRWSTKDMVDFLKTGILPFGEMVDPPMDDVVENSSSHWADDDRKAAAEYLLSLPKRETP